MYFSLWILLICKRRRILGGGDGGGGVYRGNFGTGVRASISKPIPFIYLAFEKTGVILVRVCEPVFQNLSHSYTWPLKNGPIHILDHPKC